MKKFRRVLKEFYTLSRKSKLGVVFLLLLLFIVSILITVSYWQLNTSQIRRPRSKAKAPFVEKVKEPTLASLSLLPEKQNIKSNQSFSVTINLNTGDFKVDAVDAVLKFDPQVLTVEEISPGMFFAEYPVKKSAEGKVFLTGTVGLDKNQKGGVKSEGAMGTITFKAKSAGSTTVNFDQSSLVAAEGENVLGETKGGIFEIY